MKEFQFLVKVEGYKELLVNSCANNIEEAIQELNDNLNTQGFMDIQYIIPM